MVASKGSIVENSFKQTMFWTLFKMYFVPKCFGKNFIRILWKLILMYYHFIRIYNVVQCVNSAHAEFSAHGLLNHHLAFKAGVTVWPFHSDVDKNKFSGKFGNTQFYFMI